jgi:flagellar M-ring protein FliF
MNEILAFIGKLGAMRIAAVIGATAGVAIALTLIATRLSEPNLGVLYADVELADAKSVVDRLEQEKIPYRTRERGGRMAILAPQSEIARLRMNLAADGGAPRGGVGYEIFDGEQTFGATSFQQTINRLRALEGEIARTITTISGVRSARVHLVLPERELFARERQAASASIMVDAAVPLDKRTVRAIINLTASATPGLLPSRVTVLDAAGELLASGQIEDPENGGADERKAATEARLRRTVEDILARIVGPENLRVQVAADIDFNRITENADIIDPDSQTVLSSVTVEEAANDSQPAAARGVTVANALPGADVVRQNEPAATSSTRRTEETVNYEMTRRRRTEVREQGVVRRLSVAVALNAVAGAPRSAEELARLTALARTAVGFDEKRGDRVEVIEIPFGPVGPAAPAAGATVSAKPTVTPGRIAEIGALVVIGLGLVIFVLRPLLAGDRRAARAPARLAANQAGPESGEPARALPAPTDRRIDLTQLAGQVKSSSINKVAEVVKGHTEESANILKGWIRQAS